MLTIKIDPTAIPKMVEEANGVGWPHHWAQIPGAFGEVVLDWIVDDTQRGVRITLYPNGTWSAEMDLVNS